MKRLVKVFNVQKRQRQARTMDVDGNGENVDDENCTTHDMESAQVVTGRWELLDTPSPMFETNSPTDSATDRSRAF